MHPAVLRAIKLIADAGNANGMPVGVCGEAAADPDLAVVLTGIGVNSLSMTPVALDDVRANSPASRLRKRRRRPPRPSTATSTTRPSGTSEGVTPIRP